MSPRTGENAGIHDARRSRDERRQALSLGRHPEGGAGAADRAEARLRRAHDAGARVSAKGAIVPRHAHDNEQLTYILEGSLRFWLGDDEDGETIDVLAGEVLHIPSNLPHRAEALADTLDVDVFSPPRQDWLDGTDAYLRGGG